MTETAKGVTVNRSEKNAQLDATNRGDTAINRRIDYIIAQAKDASGNISRETRDTVEELLLDLEHAYAVLARWEEDDDNELVYAAKMLFEVAIDSHRCVVNERHRTTGGAIDE